MKNKTEISAGGIVYKKNQNLWLITQHSQFGHWSFPKGLVGDENANETKEEAALREVVEEGGIKARIIKKLPIVKYKYKFIEDHVDKTVHYYLMEYISGNPENHDWEVSEAKFVSPDEVLRILTHDNDKQAFTKAKELLLKAMQSKRDKARLFT